VAAFRWRSQEGRVGSERDSAPEPHSSSLLAAPIAPVLLLDDGRQRVGAWMEARRPVLGGAGLAQLPLLYLALKAPPDLFDVFEFQLFYRARGMALPELDGTPRLVRSLVESPQVILLVALGIHAGSRRHEKSTVRTSPDRKFDCARARRRVCGISKSRRSHAATVILLAMPFLSFSGTGRYLIGIAVATRTRQIAGPDGAGALYWSLPGLVQPTDDRRAMTDWEELPPRSPA